MSSDISPELISQLLRNIQHAQNPQILSVSGSTNQTLHPNQGAVSSGGPNASQGFHVVNSNINQVILNLNAIGNTNLGTRAIANGNYEAHPNHQNSQSTAISHTNQPRIKAAESIDSDSQSSDSGTDEEDVDANTRAIANGDHGAYPDHQDSQSTANLVDLDTVDAAEIAGFKVHRATGDLTKATEQLANRTAMLSKWVTAFDWPTFKHSLFREIVVLSVDMVFKQYMSTIELSQSIIKFSRSSVEELGKSAFWVHTVRAAVRSESVSDGSASTYKEMLVGYKESCTTFMKRLPTYDITGLEKIARAHENSASQLSSVIGRAEDFTTLQEIAIALRRSAHTVRKSLTVLNKSVMDYRTVLDSLQ